MLHLAVKEIPVLYFYNTCSSNWQ